MSSYISEEYYKKLQQATVIWGHSGIGKSFLYQKKREDIIDFDFQYKGVLSSLLAFPDLIKDAKLDKEEASKLYNTSRLLVNKLFDLAIKEAKTTNKKLLISDLRLLKERNDDIDIIINIPKDVYIERTSIRKERSLESRISLKEEIDYAISNIKDKSKIFTVNCYLSDILPLSDDYIEIQRLADYKYNNNKKEYFTERYANLTKRFNYLNKELSKINLN